MGLPTLYPLTRIQNSFAFTDLKTGVGPTKFEQLEIYAALFCLEYGVQPTIQMQLRIYQHGEPRTHIPESDDIRDIMGRIVHFSDILMESDND